VPGPTRNSYNNTLKKILLQKSEFTIIYDQRIETDVSPENDGRAYLE